MGEAKGAKTERKKQWAICEKQCQSSQDAI